MQCNYCGKNIESSTVSFNGLSFCNNLCRYLWEKSKEQRVENVETTYKESSKVFLQNLDFEIDIKELGDRKLLIRASYFRGPQLYLDGVRLKPTKKERLKRLRTYTIKTDNGDELEIQLKLRAFDAVPAVFFNGNEIELVNKLTWYEYVLIIIPIILVFIGGIIGALIGGAAAYTNSILFRKINNKPLRYSSAVINIFVAVILFWKIIAFVAPYLNELQFKAQTSSATVKSDSKIYFLTNYIWETYKLTNKDRVDVSDQYKKILGSKRYFFKNGDYKQTMTDGTFLKGKWKIDDNEENITLLGSDVTKVEIVSISDKELIVKYNDLYIYHKAI